MNYSTVNAASEGEFSWIDGLRNSMNISFLRKDNQRVTKFPQQFVELEIMRNINGQTYSDENFMNFQRVPEICSQPFQFLSTEPQGVGLELCTVRWEGIEDWDWSHLGTVHHLLNCCDVWVHRSGMSRVAMACTSAFSEHCYRTQNTSPDFWRQLVNEIMLSGDVERSHSGIMLLLAVLESVLMKLYARRRTQEHATAALFREVLLSEVVKQLLPVGLVGSLTLLFLPEHGINLRNLLWHGFLSPAELPQKFGPFLLLLTLGLLECVPEQPQNCCEKLCWDMQFYTFSNQAMHSKNELNAAICSLASQLCSASGLNELQSLVSHSLFIPPGFNGVVQRALAHLVENSQSVRALCTLVPCLEQGLRGLFCAANSAPTHLQARVGQYYSTLDGYGQRSKHQLLLDAFFENNTSCPNMLLEELGDGFVSILLDLFMFEDGPNLRAKLAHGEVDFSLSFSDKGMSRSADQQPVVSLFLILFTALCYKYPSPQQGCCSNFFPAKACAEFVAGYTSQFQPLGNFEKELRMAFNGLMDLKYEVEAHSYELQKVSSEEGSEKGQAFISIKSPRSQEPIVLFDKASRMLGEEMAPESTNEGKNKNKAGTKAVSQSIRILAQELNMQVTTYLETADARSTFLFAASQKNMQVEAHGTMFETDEKSQKAEIPELSFDVHDPRLASWVNIPSLNLLKSMTEVVTTIVKTLLQRMRILEEEVMTGTAHTPQRKFYWATIFAWQCILNVCVLCMCIIECYVHTCISTDFPLHTKPNYNSEDNEKEGTAQILQYQNTLKRLSKILSAFSLCVVSSTKQSNSHTLENNSCTESNSNEQKDGRKGYEKCFPQVITFLKTKAGMAMKSLIKT